MEHEEHLHSVMYQGYHLPLSKIFTLKDYYNEVKEVNIESLKIEVTEKIKESLEWALDNPEFDFKTIMSTPYSNKIMFRWFIIKYEDLCFLNEKFKEPRYTISAKDVEGDYLPDRYKSLRSDYL